MKSGDVVVVKRAGKEPRTDIFGKVLVGEPQKCQDCARRTARLHVTELHGGRRSQLHLCRACASKRGISVW